MDDFKTSEDMLRDFRASHAAPQAPPEQAAPEAPAPAPPVTPPVPPPPPGAGDPFGGRPAEEPYDPQTAPATGDDRHADWTPKGRSGPANPALRSKLGKLRPLIVLAVIGAFAVGNLGSLFDSGTAVDALTVGDCFEDPGLGTDLVDKVDTVDCAEPHDFEVFSLPRHPASDSSPYPGETTLFGWADEACMATFEAYVGISFEESQLFFANMVPTVESWDQGDRTANCMLMRLDDGFEVTSSVGSYRNSGI